MKKTELFLGCLLGGSVVGAIWMICSLRTEGPELDSTPAVTLSVKIDSHIEEEKVSSRHETKKAVSIPLLVPYLHRSFGQRAGNSEKVGGGVKEVSRVFVLSSSELRDLQNVLDRLLKESKNDGGVRIGSAWYEITRQSGEVEPTTLAYLTDKGRPVLFGPEVYSLEIRWPGNSMRLDLDFDDCVCRYSHIERRA